ncbi:MAG: flagellar hook-basal body complex protein FliE [Pseudomonadota bacterium]
MDIRATQAERLYSGVRPATKAAGDGPSTADASAGRRFADAAENFADTLARAEQTAKDAMVGKADPHALVQALSQTELAVETAVAVRDKVVEAYQEILRMPV